MVIFWLWITNNACLLVGLYNARKNGTSYITAALLSYNLGVIYIAWLYRKEIFNFNKEKEVVDHEYKK